MTLPADLPQVRSKSCMAESHSPGEKIREIPIGTLSTYLYELLVEL